MNAFEQNLERARAAFTECVKSPLLELLGADEILSIEGDAPNSTVSALLDKAGTSDLLLNYQTQGLLQSAASRISFISDEWQSEQPPPISMSLGNGAVAKSADAELNKLWRMVCAFDAGVPVVFPGYLCMSQVDLRGGQFRLVDLLAVETAPLLRTVFDRVALNLPELRRRFSAVRATPPQGQSKDKAPCVQFADLGRDYAGLRANKNGGSFFFFTKEFLDDYALPYRRRVSQSNSGSKHV